MKSRGTSGPRFGWKALRCVAGFSFFLLPVLCQAQSQPVYTISTMAGTGTSGYEGDSGQAVSAKLAGPSNIVLDNSGNLYFADQVNSRIRKIAPGGTITTIAGNGTPDYAGDGKAATDASLKYPAGIVFDKAGNLYIADTYNHRIRKVATDGKISTFAGNGNQDFTGDDGLAIVASLKFPVGLAVDGSGSLYIADSGNYRIRKVNTDGYISTVAGNGTIGYAGDRDAATGASLDHPVGVSFDTAGNLYIVDSGNGAIRKVNLLGLITTVVGTGINDYSGDGGPASEASLSHPVSMVFDVSGNMHIADTGNSRIRTVAPDGTIRTIAGNGISGDRGDGGMAVYANLRFPGGLVADATGKVFVSDTQNNRIRLLTPVTGTAGGPPLINPGGVMGAAAFGGSTSVAPGSWIEIYGMNLASSSRGWTAADFSGNKAPTSLDGTFVNVDSEYAYIAYVSPTQVNALLPSSLSIGRHQVRVVTPAGASEPFAIAVNPLQPGLCAPPTFQISGKQYVAALSALTGLFALPSGAVAGVSSRPVRPGETVMMFGTGFGPVTPPIDAGEIVQQSNTVDAPVEFYIGQTAATVEYAGLAPGTVGLYQFNVVVPNIAASDATPVTFSQGGMRGAQTLYIAVGN